MQKIEILVVGKHPEIMKTILRLINGKPQWSGHIAFTVEEAFEKADTLNFAAVLLGAGLSAEETRQLQKHFSVPVVQHYGGGSGLLYAEIYQATGL